MAPPTSARLLCSSGRTSAGQAGPPAEGSAWTRPRGQLTPRRAGGPRSIHRVGVVTEVGAGGRGPVTTRGALVARGSRLACEFRAASFPATWGGGKARETWAGGAGTRLCETCNGAFGLLFLWTVGIVTAIVSHLLLRLLLSINPSSPIAEWRVSHSLPSEASFGWSTNWLSRDVLPCGDHRRPRLLSTCGRRGASGAWAYVTLTRGGGVGADPGGGLRESGVCNPGPRAMVMRKSTYCPRPFLRRWAVD